jgi:hypothetical protein
MGLLLRLGADVLYLDWVFAIEIPERLAEENQPLFRTWHRALYEYVIISDLAVIYKTAFNIHAVLAYFKKALVELRPGLEAHLSCLRNRAW